MKISRRKQGSCPFSVFLLGIAVQSIMLPFFFLDRLSTHNITKLVTEKPHICLITADFWALPSPGGTSTAFALLAEVLASDSRFDVTLVGVADDCNDMNQQVFRPKAPHVVLCGKRRPFGSNSPYEKRGILVKEWLQDANNTCNIVHGHEWGGLMSFSLVFHHLGGFQRQRTFVIQLHGGHFWSAQHSRTIETGDLVSLKIDAGEKQSVELADVVVAPTHYMLSYYAQRGWSISNSFVIGNILSSVSISGSMYPETKPVSKIGFFGRLEERKGILLFLQMLQLLPLTIKTRPGFKVYFIGTEGFVNGMAGSEYVEKEMGRQNIAFELILGKSRSDALQYIRDLNGLFLVFLSLAENAPYVLVEAGMIRVPFLTLDVGGSSEVVQLNSNNSLEYIEGDETGTIAALASKVTHFLESGKAPLTKLVDTNSTEHWVSWHLNTISRQYHTLQPVKRNPCPNLSIFSVEATQRFSMLFEALCFAPSRNVLYLLLPQGYHLDETSWVENCHLFTDLKEAVAGGVWTSEGFTSYPSSPDWMLYKSSNIGKHCTPMFPIIIMQTTFCNLDIPAKLFQDYTPWSLALLLKKRNKDLLTIPLPFFNASMSAWPMASSACNRFDHLRRFLTPDVAASLRKDPQFTFLHSLLPQPLRLAAFNDNSVGNPNSWFFGYGTNFEGFSEFLSFEENGTTVWGCTGSKATHRHRYPFSRENMLHPCVRRKGNGCCGVASAAVFAGFRSWFSLDKVIVELKFTTCPVCGDGVDIYFFHQTNDGIDTRTLHKEAVEPKKGGPCAVRLLRSKLDIAVGDQIVFGVFPGKGQDCDGIYIDKWTILK